MVKGGRFGMDSRPPSHFDRLVSGKEWPQGCGEPRIDSSLTFLPLFLLPR